MNKTLLGARPFRLVFSTTERRRSRRRPPRTEVGTEEERRRKEERGIRLRTRPELKRSRHVAIDKFAFIVRLLSRRVCMLTVRGSASEQEREKVMRERMGGRVEIHCKQAVLLKADRTVLSNLIRSNFLPRATAATDVAFCRRRRDARSHGEATRSVVSANGVVSRMVRNTEDSRPRFRLEAVCRFVARTVLNPFNY